MVGAASTRTKRPLGSHAADTDGGSNKRQPSRRDSEVRAESVSATDEERAESADAGLLDANKSLVVTIPLLRRYEAEAVASKAHLAHLTGLLAHIEQQQYGEAGNSTSPSSPAALHTLTAAYQSLYRILEHYVEVGELSLVSGPSGASTSLAGQLRVWLHSQFSRYVACSLSFIGHSHSPLQLSALHALMSLVRLSTAALQPDTAASRLTCGGLYASVIHAALASPHYDAIHDTLTSQYLLPYTDLRVFALRAIKANIAHTERNSNRAQATDKANTDTEAAVAPPADSDTAVHNTLTLLLELSKPATPSPTSSLTTAIVSSTALASSLSATYLSFLSVRHTPATYKRVLEQLDSHILPNVSNPLLLADFLTDSYNIGGIVSLLALAALFHLISHYNLDYPHFYHKLYSLCTPALTLSRHRTHLFVLLSKFLSSTYLPSSLVAAFCKRLARLAIVGGSGVDGSVELMRLVWGLLRRNKSVAGMVWGQQEVQRVREVRMESLTDFLLKRQAELAAESERSNESATGADDSGMSGQHDDIFDDHLSDEELREASSHTASGSSGDSLTAIQFTSLTSSAAPAAFLSASSFTADPFLPLLNDPAACSATASTLWELRTLTHHYAPAVRALAALFYAENAPKGELDAVGVGRVGETEGYDGMLRREMERRKNQKVAVNFSKRATLFEEGDIVSANFTLS